MLRHELRALGLAWTVRDNGLGELADVPPRVLRAFSRRRVEIETAMAERGVIDGSGAQVSTLATRRPRSMGCARSPLAAEWHARADPLGFDGRARAALLHRVASEPAHPEFVHATAELLFPGRVDRTGVHVHPAEHDPRLMLRLQHGAPVKEVEVLADRLLTSPGLVPLAPQEMQATSAQPSRGVAARNAGRSPPGCSGPPPARMPRCARGGVVVSRHHGRRTLRRPRL